MCPHRMRNAVLSSVWALAGGFIAFLACCWAGDWITEKVLFPHAKIVIGPEVNMVVFFAVPISLCVAGWCTRLFYAGRLPGYRSKS
jgi:hypothetical protein